jgi:hypothetical protein
MRDLLIGSGSRNGHKRISIGAVVWHNAINPQIMAQGVFEDRSATMRCAQIPLPLGE